MLKQRLVRLAWFVGPLALAVAAVGTVSQSASYVIRRDVVTGGVEAGSASYVVRATSSPLSSATTQASSASYVLEGGFWPVSQLRSIFADGFESGDVAAWTASTP